MSWFLSLITTNVSAVFLSPQVESPPQQQSGSFLRGKTSPWSLYHESSSIEIHRYRSRRQKEWCFNFVQRHTLKHQKHRSWSVKNHDMVRLMSFSVLGRDQCRVHRARRYFCAQASFPVGEGLVVVRALPRFLVISALTFKHQKHVVIGQKPRLGVRAFFF